MQRFLGTFLTLDKLYEMLIIGVDNKSLERVKLSLYGMMKIQEASLAKTNKRPLWPLLLIGGGLIILIAALASIFLFSGDDGTSTAGNTGQEDPYSLIARVDVATAKSAHDAGEAVIVDVRDEIYFNDGHIQGAISIPLSQLESRIGELDSADWIILYCT
jgi:hypothetical protein